MQNATGSEYLIRERVLELLASREIAGSASAETAEHLEAGEEYLDLGQLHEGVQIAGSSATPMGRVLTKKSVDESTWSKILKQLEQPPS